MDLIIQTSDGGSPFYIDIGYFDTVLEIKEKIHKRLGVPVSEQTLIFNGNILPDDLNVHDSDILDRSRIRLVIAGTDQDIPPPPKLRRLYLKLPASRAVSVEVDANDTIQRLKERVREVAGTPTEPIAIHANGNELADHKTVLECRLAENSDLTVHSLSSSAMNAAPPRAATQGGLMKLRVVVEFGAEKVVVEVRAAENVGELRKKLQKSRLNNLPEEGYFFIHDQTVMEDDRSFRWHHVGENDTIQIFRGTVSGGS